MITMVIVGLNITKIDAERKSGGSAKVSINNNVSIEKVEEQKLNIGKSSQYGLRYEFSYSTIYEPAMGHIKFGGNIITVEDEKVGKDIMEGFKKSKKLPDSVMGMLLNAVLRKCSVQAVVLSQEIALPSPVPLPKVKVGAAPAKK